MMGRRLSLVTVVLVLIALGAAWAAQVARSAPQATATPLKMAQAPTLPPTITPSFTPPEPPATPTASATATPGPHEYVVRAGDSCWLIAANFGLSADAIGAIEALNGAGKCSTLREGETILVPRPTATPTPQGADMTQTAVATAAPPQITLDTGPSFAIDRYTIQSGDTLSSIAIIHDSSLQQICELNPLPDGIDCSACEWESPNCCCSRPVVLSAGQEINVPAPTPTPTLTPTFSGSETPTATPTHRAPGPTFPLPGATVSGPVRLTWLSAGVLADDEHYLVTVRDEATGAVLNVATRKLSLDVPADFLPNDGEAHEFVWQVGIVRLGDDGLFYPIGGVVQPQPFTWTGW